jgi:RNA 2',3'-cyclic 3'-phosphodiesterase
MRLFIAFIINEKVGVELLSLAAHYFSDKPCQWYPPEKLHLTMQFLGEVDPQQLPKIDAVLAPLFHSVKAFELEITEFAFLKEKTLVALTTNPPELQQLHHDLEQALQPFVLTQDRHEFRPHITLSGNCPQMKIENLAQANQQPFNLTRLSLLESSAEKTQSIYIEHQYYDLLLCNS